jgi:hypothetical protein
MSTIQWHILVGVGVVLVGGTSLLTHKGRAQKRAERLFYLRKEIAKQVIGRLRAKYDSDTSQLRDVLNSEFQERNLGAGWRDCVVSLVKGVGWRVTILTLPEPEKTEPNWPALVRMTSEYRLPRVRGETALQTLKEVTNMVLAGVYTQQNKIYDRPERLYAP